LQVYAVFHPQLARCVAFRSADVASDDPQDPADRAMSRYADGDDAAFALVHRAVVERLRAFLLRLARSPSLADDLVQETFLRVHRARGSFARGARVVPWCYAIARNVYLDHARSAQVRRDRVHVGEEDVAEAPGPSADGEETTIAAEMAAVVERTLARIPPNQREAFILIRYEALSVRDAAAVLGTTEGAVKLRAFHAYEALRAAIRGVSDEDEAAAKKRGPS
jgi:RNA polymerase sigma-70 factor (ECF subfamily)